MATWSKALLLTLGAFVVGSGLGYYFAPAKIKTVEKIITVEKTKVNRDIKTTITERADGTKVTEITDKTKEDTTIDSKTQKSKEVTREKKDWIVGGGIIGTLKGNPEYFGEVKRRVFGEVYVGAFGTSKGKVGVGLAFRF